MIDEFMDRIERVPPDMLKKLLSGALWEGTPESSTLAMTFDDGPDPGVTPLVLDALDEAGACGTFFVVGENARKHPDIIRDTVSRGHSVGNHTMHHRRLFFAGREETAREIDEAGRALADITGQAPTLFRPPHGLFDLTALAEIRKRNLTLVLWTALAGDYSDRPRDGILDAVSPFVRAGSIVVFHDTMRGGGGELPGIVRDIASLAAERGIVPGAVEELAVSPEMELAEDADA